MEYVEAFWNKDIDRIVSLLTAEATWEMPPFTGWYSGPESIGTLIDTKCPGGHHDMPMIRTDANGQPAFALYMRTPEGDFEPFHMQVLRARRRPGRARQRVLRPRGVRQVRPPRPAPRRLPRLTR